jgi:hypothetical protein
VNKLDKQNGQPTAHFIGVKSMTEQQYIEKQMVEMLNKTYDKLLVVAKESKHGEEALELAGTRQEYINNEMNKWREANLDGDKEILSADEVIMIQNSDAAAESVRYGSAPIPSGATDLMKEIQDLAGFFEISAFDDQIILSKGHGDIFQFKIPISIFKTMIKHFIEIGLDSLKESDGRRNYLRVPIDNETI